MRVKFGKPAVNPFDKDLENSLQERALGLAANLKQRDTKLIDKLDKLVINSCEASFRGKILAAMKGTAQIRPDLSPQKNHNDATAPSSAKSTPTPDICLPSKRTTLEDAEEQDELDILLGNRKTPISNTAMPAPSLNKRPKIDNIAAPILAPITPAKVEEDDDIGILLGLNKPKPERSETSQDKQSLTFGGVVIEEQNEFSFQGPNEDQKMAESFVPETKDDHDVRGFVNNNDDSNLSVNMRHQAYS